MNPHEITNWNEETRQRVQRAVDYFRQGYNCSQAVAMALCDFYGLRPALVARLSASFGGGIGRMRQVCGAASGIFLLAGMEVTEPGDACTAEMPDHLENLYPSAALKKSNYQVVQHLAAGFVEQCGSMHCGELLAQPTPKSGTALARPWPSPTPEERNEAYYKRRPCTHMVESAVRVYMDYLRQKYAADI